MSLLIKLLQLACPEKTNSCFYSWPKKQIKNVQLLVIQTVTKLPDKIKLKYFDENELKENDQQRALVLKTCITCVSQFIQTYSNLLAIIEIIQPFKALLATIKDTCLCEQIKEQCKQVLIQIDDIEKVTREQRKPLVQKKKNEQNL